MYTQGTGLEFISRTATDKNHITYKGFHDSYLLPECCDNPKTWEFYSAKKILWESEKEYLITNVLVKDAILDIKDKIDFNEIRESETNREYNHPTTFEEQQYNSDEVEYVVRKKD